MSLFRKIFRAIKKTIRDHRAPKWVAEPVRRIANYVVALTVAAGAVLVAATAFTDAVPSKYRDQFSAFIVAATAVVAVVAKVAGEIARSKVFAPATYAAAAAAATAVANGQTLVPASIVITDPSTISK